MSSRKSMGFILLETLLLLFIYYVSKHNFEELVTILILTASIVCFELLNNKILKKESRYEQRSLNILTGMQAYGILFWVMIGCGIHSIETGLELIIAILATLLFAISEIILLWIQYKGKVATPTKEMKRHIVYLHILNLLFILQFVVLFAK